MKHALLALSLLAALASCASTDDDGAPVAWNGAGRATWRAVCDSGHDWNGPPLDSLAQAQGSARDHDLKEHDGAKTARVSEE